MAKIKLGVNASQKMQINIAVPMQVHPKVSRESIVDVKDIASKNADGVVVDADTIALLNADPAFAALVAGGFIVVE